MNATYLLVLNGGSSSVKFSVFDRVNESCVGQGSISGVGTTPKISAKGALFEGHPLPSMETVKSTSDAVQTLVAWLGNVLPKGALAAVGHRVVHGGDRATPVRVTPEILDDLRKLIPLVPLHQPYNLEAIDAIAAKHPEVPQVACFDTAFHATIPTQHRRLGLSRVWHDKGVKRYGFHGLSYEYIAGRLKDIAPKTYAGRTLIAHLGNGSSLCALKNGQSFDTTMGFSSLDGLLMGTRTGALDPGVIMYFLQAEGMDAKTLENLLYRTSGLLGVSGISSDMRELLESTNAAAREATDLYSHRLLREASALIGLMGGIDALVFTGGIGEHAAKIRTDLAKGLSWMGVQVDEVKNTTATGSVEEKLSSPQSTADIWLIPTNEELVIARHAAEVLDKTPA